MAKPKPGTVALDGSKRIKEFRGAKTDAGRTLVLNAEGQHAGKRFSPDHQRECVLHDELGDRAHEALREQNR